MASKDYAPTLTSKDNNYQHLCPMIIARSFSPFRDQEKQYQAELVANGLQPQVTTLSPSRYLQ